MDPGVNNCLRVVPWRFDLIMRADLRRMLRGPVRVRAPRLPVEMQRQRRRSEIVIARIVRQILPGCRFCKLQQINLIDDRNMFREIFHHAPINHFRGVAMRPQFRQLSN